MDGKIGLEEHFSLPEFEEDLPEYVDITGMRERLLLGEQRLEEMDASGIELALLSLNNPGVQAITDAQRAVSLAQKANDALAEAVRQQPTRYAGLGALPMQDPQAAVTELVRCVNELGFPGVNLNGYTNAGNANTGWYYDHKRFLPFWECAEALGVPVYLHPRDPMPKNQSIFEGHPELMGATWAYTVEAATHALRLMTSGLFDRFPHLTIILGHLGESLPFNIWRIEHRVKEWGDRVKIREPLSHYLQTNFYLTTSGSFRTQSLVATMSEVGSDRVLFASDYPCESMREAAAWFDSASISDTDRIKIGRTNAQHLFGLGPWSGESVAGSGYPSTDFGHLRDTTGVAPFVDAS
jgi:predicted TIM-barrel fold metal-dependent hydrolase